ncbi:MAG TPA: hypothetical protein VNR65_16745, partial [Geobacterales bacterium]|nr:hypothetical protein [Geobacterales bacterium]
VGREFFTRIGKFEREHQTSLANQWRLQCGGSLPNGPFLEADPIVNSIATMVRDLFPAIMLAIHQGGLSESVLTLKDAVQAQGPALKEFMLHLPQDSLRLIVDPRGIDLDRRATILWSSGHSQVIDRTLLPLDLVLAVVERIRLLGDFATISFDQVVGMIRRVIDDARALGLGEAADVPVIAGLGGLRIVQDPIRISVSDAGPGVQLTNRLEGLLLQHKRRAPFVVEEGVMCQLVFEDECRRLAISDSGLQDVKPSEELRGEIEATARRRQQLLDHFRIGVLLSTDARGARTPVLVAERAIGPLGPRGFVEIIESERVAIFHEPAGRPPGVPYDGWPVISGRVAEDVAMSIRAAKHPGLAVASRRLCLANGTRADPVDRLIDSAVGYEAMFGGQDEKKKYRSVAKAMAKAMAYAIDDRTPTDPVKTAAMIEEISHLRNHHVHGEQDLSRSDLERVARVASGIGLLAFSSIIRDTELLDAPSSFRRRHIVAIRHDFDVMTGKPLTT